MNDSDFSIVWSFRNRTDVLWRSLSTANGSTPRGVRFYLVDAASDESEIRKIRGYLLGREYRVCESFCRTSVSEAWNLGIMLSGARYVVFVSSDVEFLKDGWFEALKAKAEAGAQYVLIENHAVFMIDTRIVPVMGWFDERYGIGPHFDTDFMIRAGEAGIEVHGVPNDGYFLHGHDNIDTEGQRVSIPDDDPRVKDRLPMHDKGNEAWFKAKWASGWEGWDRYVHPPNHISQVRRLMPEVDPHPFFTEKLKCR